MQEYTVRILENGFVTHNVKYFRVERPVNYSFLSGQATEVSVNTPDLRNERRPFTFTNLPSDTYLEFMIKRYPEHHGVTDAIHRLQNGDELIINDVFGAITYRGKGYFIAGGAGITPFISIIRHLNQNHQLAGNFLIFANRTGNDIILEPELRKLLGNNFVNILSDESISGYNHGHLSEEFLRKNINDISGYFYVCGPPPMMDLVLPVLKTIGITDQQIIVESE